MDYISCEVLCDGFACMVNVRASSPSSLTDGLSCEMQENPLTIPPSVSHSTEPIFLSDVGEALFESQQDLNHQLVVDQQVRLPIQCVNSLQYSVTWCITLR